MKVASPHLPLGHGVEGQIGTETRPFSIDDVRELAQVLRDFDLSELQLVRPGPGGEQLRLRRQAEEPALARTALRPASAVAEASSSAAGATGAAGTGKPGPEAKEEGTVLVTSPFVGTFYRSPGPDVGSFVEVGHSVRKGQTLCIIEAMKLMNELEAEVAGIVVACLAENGRPVEYGEPLFRIRVA